MKDSLFILGFRLPIAPLHRSLWPSFWSSFTRSRAAIRRTERPARPSSIRVYKEPVTSLLLHIDIRTGDAAQGSVTICL
jgi:hypothetical protein